MAAKSSSPDSQIQHECEEFEDYNGEVDNLNRQNWCKKNPGHANFLPVCGLKMEDVPPQLQTDEGMRFIHYACNLTVRITVSYVSVNRPDTWSGSDNPYPFGDCKGSSRMVRNGTGYIGGVEMYDDKPCPCEECEMSGHPVTGYMVVNVWTARHVVYDDTEGVQTKVEYFYDTPGMTGVVLLCGVKTILDNDSDVPGNDKITVCCYTHNKDFMDKLNRINIISDPWVFDVSGLDSGFTVSHPHGLHKQISFGHPRFYSYSISNDHFAEYPGFVQCRFKRPFFTHNTPISQYQDKRQDDKENELHLENVTCLSLAESGAEYLLPDTSKICVPCRHGYLLDWRYGDAGWRQIPEGGGYTDSTTNGRLVHFPPGMEIFCKFDEYFTSIYDIPTCPGSSGACVYIYNKRGGTLHHGFVHSGQDTVILGNKGFFEYL